MKQRKSLSTLAGRKVSASTDDTKAHKKTSEPGSAQATPVTVAPPRRALRTARKYSSSTFVLLFLAIFCKSHYSSSCSIRPSGSESLPGIEAHDAATYEDVSTCAVTDFQVMDSIPEHTPATGEHPSFGFEIYHCFVLLFIAFPFTKHGYRLRHRSYPCCG